MNLSAVFIRRPVATSLLTLAVALGGMLAFFKLPVAALPQVDFPTISVSAQLPGASAETMATTVATPLERALGRIAGITEMTSTSSMGSTSITLQFELSRDINGAAREVQAAINAASSLLPLNMPTRPSYRYFNPSDSPILILALTSESVGNGQLYDIASTILAQKFLQVQGVGQVQINGAALPAVRIELNPNALAKYGIGLEQVRNTITQAHRVRPKGFIENARYRWQIQANDQLRQAADYAPLIVRYRDGAPVRLSDVAMITDSVEDLRNTGIKDGKPAVLLLLRKQAQANVITTVEQLKALLPSLQAALPGGVELSIVVDRTLSIRASIDEVEHSLLIAVLLVIGVVLLFLRDWRATLIPIVAVPVSLLGACAVISVFDYSINNLSLMALTIATGFVVDDAIVVLENARRHIEHGEKPFKAALMAVREVGFTVLAMSVSLVAVFLPILLMGGIVGRLFREFAVTLSAAVLVSLVISLTATPMLCARWLQPDSDAAHGRGYRLLARAFAGLQRGYERSLHWALRHSRWMLLLLFATIGLNIHLYGVIDKGFFPTQDGGRLIGEIQADQSISFWALQQKLSTFAAALQQDQAVTHIAGFVDSRDTNTGRLFIVLKPHQQRDPLEKVTKRLRERAERIAGAQLRLYPSQELRIGGRPTAGLYDYTLQADDLNLLRLWTPKIQAALAKLPELNDVNSGQQDKGQQISLHVNRELAARYDITQAMVDATLNNAFGQRQVAVIYNPLNQYRVVMEFAPEYWAIPEVLKQLYISVPPKPGDNSATAGQVPLSSIASFAPRNTPLRVNHQGQFASSNIAFNLKDGVSLSQATQLIEQTMQQIGVPSSVLGGFQGSAKAFKESMSNQPWLILAALVSIYIVLGVLYESLIHPLTILSTLPSAGVGALLALMACDTEFSLIALIGVILLIGIVKKNAIMMIDFALQAEREQGLNSQDAIFKACALRFRPILMTTFAALFGALPLALGSGHGAELRQPLGISIIGGLIFSQMLTLYTTPVVYLYLDRWRRFMPTIKIAK